MSHRLLLVVEASTLLLVFLVLVSKLIRRFVTRKAHAARCHGPRVVLILCDDTNVSHQLKEQLSSKGCRTAEAAVCEEGLMQAAQQLKQKYGRVDVIGLIWRAEQPANSLHDFAEEVRNRLMQQLCQLKSVSHAASLVQATSLVCVSLRSDSRSTSAGNGYEGCQERLDTLIRIYGEKCVGSGVDSVDVRWYKTTQLDHIVRVILTPRHFLRDLFWYVKDVAIEAIWKGIKVLK